MSVTVDLCDFDENEVIEYAKIICERRGILDQPWWEEEPNENDITVAYNVLSAGALQARDNGDICRANSLELVAKGLLYGGKK